MGNRQRASAHVARTPGVIAEHLEDVDNVRSNLPFWDSPIMRMLCEANALRGLSR